MSYLSENWFLIGTFVVLVYVLLLRFGPHTGYRYRTERLIRAPLGTVRSVVFEQVDTEGRFGTQMVRGPADPADPDVATYACRNAAGTAFEMRIRTLETSALTLRLRVESITLSRSGLAMPFPLGHDNLSTYTLEDMPEGVRLTFETFYRQRSPINGLFLSPRGFARTLDRVRDYCETGTTAPVSRLSARLVTAINLVSVGILLAAFGWEIGLTMIAALVVHEVGHVIGFRLVGARVLGIRMVPFLGAVAIGSPPATALRRAIVSLAGVAFSLVPILLMIGAVVHFRLPIAGAEFDFAAASSGALLLGIIKIVSLVNAFQLVPVPVFDGGETLSAAFSGFSQRLSVPLIALAGVVTAAYVGATIGTEIGLLVLIPSLASLSMLVRPPAQFAVRTGVGAMIVILMLYGAAIGAYAGIVHWAYDQHPTGILRAAPDPRLTELRRARTIWWAAETQLDDLARAADPCRAGCSGPVFPPPRGPAGPEAVALWDAGPLYWPDTLLPGSFVGPRVCRWCSREPADVDWPD